MSPIPDAMEGDITAIERVHRGMSSSLLWLSLLFFFLVFSFISSLDSSIAITLGIISIAFNAILLSIYFGFLRRRNWAYKFAMAHWLFLILICSFTGILNLITGLQGEILSLIMSGMLFFISVGLVKRFSTFSNPLFIAWYLGKSNQILAASKLEGNEMMGACPHCLSLLAVKPLELSRGDLCPNCGGDLVSEETYSRFSILEEE